MPMPDHHTLSLRQRQLLAVIVATHIKTCAPVGSKLIAGQTLDCSAATIRNDMADLEAAGLLTQPHPSAGRLPTSAGYQYYVDCALDDYRLTAAERRALQPPSGDDQRLAVKTMAKTLAELTQGCVVVGFTPHDVYYTGIANLFGQPEFRDYQFSFSMTEVIDHLDVVMAELFQPYLRLHQVQILIGDRNPFGAHCSALVTSWSRVDGAGLMGVLGPLRMHYARNRGLLARTGQAVSE